MKNKNLKDIAVLIGLSPEDQCVYSALMPLDEYWDGEHVWDSSKKIKKLGLEKLKGFLFGSKGELLQEFESIFNLKTGIFKSGWVRHEDGTYEKH